MGVDGSKKMIEIQIKQKKIRKQLPYEVSLFGDSFFPFGNINEGEDKITSKPTNFREIPLHWVSDRI